MCGISGSIGENASEHAITMIRALASRGTQAAGIALLDASGGCDITYAATPSALHAPESAAGVTLALAHVLHAMVGCVPEPLMRAHGSGVLVANCEIYNWRALAERSGITARNDADLLLALLDEQPRVDEHAIAHVCEQLDGVYAFAYARDGQLVLARDILGVKPLFIAHHARTFAFASERKALTAAGFIHTHELFPRTILRIDATTHEHSELYRPFYEHTATRTPSDEDSDTTLQRITPAIHAAIEKRIPDEPFALFLGGGVESAILAQVLAPHTPHCYVVGTEGSVDVEHARTITTRLGLPLTVISLDDETVTRALPHILDAIEDGNAVKTGVAIVTWFASEAAQKEGLRCAFSGLGADEVFAATDRARASTEPHREIVSALRKLHERALFRDDAITMRHGIELRLPFLDHTVIETALTASTAALQGTRDKAPLRDAAIMLDVPRTEAEWTRRAPQYGSGAMKTLARVQRNTGFARIGDASALTRGTPHLRLAALLSGGKDSVLALHIMKRMGYDIACCVTIASDNPDSYLYHTPNVALAKLQAEAMNTPFLTARTHGEPERELDALKHILEEAKKLHSIQGVITGAIRSQYQRERIEKLADSLSLTTFSPLWQTDQLEELRRLVRDGYSVIFTKVAAEGLDASWLGEELTGARIRTLAALAKSAGIQPAGEGGEYETLVLDAPLFHERLAIGGTEAIKDGLAATLLIRDARLVPKPNHSRTE